ncbi:uncharacterized protein HD556DRAFT_1451514 [Suillus plorans]|uniref:Uncharacterized protein n=1 Tax=Suillus plorans TaxID=116603 RepID=A0A9P7AAP3_9AGAM|nr:uncharacterized protein HD556DRAFT_1451514 [Suillus plorans]KAG1784670.1 hypothetical protein HD556DRAFT_1451514 [Suillus plorans]
MAPASLPSAATPVTHPSQHPSQLPLVPARRSGRLKVPTPAGRAFSEGMAATKECLTCLRDLREARTAGSAPLSEGVREKSVNIDAGTEVEAGNENLADIEPNIDIPEVYANVMIEEHTNITIRSDHK